MTSRRSSRNNNDDLLGSSSKGMEHIHKGDPEDVFSLSSSLGEGSYGAVWEATNKKTNEKVAIKIIPIDNDLPDLLREIDILASCKSEFIVGFRGAWLKDKNLWIAMEFCEGGSVNDILHIRQECFPEIFIRIFCAASLLGLDYLHGNKMIHRDIKAGNILLTKNGQAKLADFGVSAQLSEHTLKRRTVIGTPFWMAPEVIQEVNYDSKADIWSLGITLIELAECDPPHSNIHPMRAIFMIPSRPAPTLKEPDLWSDNMVDFLSLCLKKNPEERPNAKELMSHPFVANQIEALKNAKPPGSSEKVKKLVADHAAEILQYREIQTSHVLDQTKRTPSAGDTAMFLDVMDEDRDQGTVTSTGTMVRDPAAVTTKRPISVAVTGGGDTMKMEAEPDFMAYFRTTKKSEDPSKEKSSSSRDSKRASKKSPQRQAATSGRNQAAVDSGTMDIDPEELRQLKTRLHKLDKQFKLDLKDLKTQYEKRKAALMAAGQAQS